MGNNPKHYVVAGVNSQQHLSEDSEHVRDPDGAQENNYAGLSPWIAGLDPDAVLLVWPRMGTRFLCLQGGR